MTTTLRSLGTLPALRKAGPAYLVVLLLMVVGFYLLMLACLAAVGWALYELIIWTPAYLSRVRGSGALKLLFFAYAAVALFGWAIIKGFLARVGGDPLGIRCSRQEHPAIFAISDEVAHRVGAQPIDEIFLTPEDEIGVWEESALYMPPGMGRRKLVMGMGAMNYLTTDQLKSILAHEYGHFSNRDTFFSRFIYRVSSSYHAILGELGGSKLQYVNPCYWLLRGYVAIYEMISASFSRRREFAADRFAVEAYGQKLFGGALVAAHVEGAFFNQVGVGEVLRLAGEGKGFKNLYHFVGSTRKNLDREHPESTAEVTKGILSTRTGMFDSHPSLRERIEMQGIKPATLPAATPPRVACCPEIEEGMDPAETDQLHIGPPTVAEDLFGDDLQTIQSELSDLVSAKYQYLLQLQAQAAQEG
jgi:Zn-dependent protease with chaperone function